MKNYQETAYFLVFGTKNDSSSSTVVNFICYVEGTMSRKT